MNLLAKKHEEYNYSLSVQHGGKNWELFHIPESIKRFFIFALHINPFHLMLQSVLFRMMNKSIMWTPRDIGFYWKDGGPRTIMPQGP